MTLMTIDGGSWVYQSLPSCEGSRAAPIYFWTHYLDDSEWCAQVMDDTAPGERTHYTVAVFGPNYRYVNDSIAWLDFDRARQHAILIALDHRQAWLRGEIS